MSEWERWNNAIWLTKIRLLAYQQLNSQWKWFACDGGKRSVSYIDFVRFGKRAFFPQNRTCVSMFFVPICVLWVSLMHTTVRLIKLLDNELERRYRCVSFARSLARTVASVCSTEECVVPTRKDNSCRAPRKGAVIYQMITVKGVWSILYFSLSLSRWVFLICGKSTHYHGETVDVRNFPPLLMKLNAYAKIEFHHDESFFCFSHS